MTHPLVAGRRLRGRPVANAVDCVNAASQHAMPSGEVTKAALSWHLLRPYQDLLNCLVAPSWSVGLHFCFMAGRHAFGSMTLP